MHCCFFLFIAIVSHERLIDTSLIDLPVKINNRMNPKQNLFSHCTGVCSIVRCLFDIVPWQWTRGFMQTRGYQFHSFIYVMFSIYSIASGSLDVTSLGSCIKICCYLWNKKTKKRSSENGRRIFSARNENSFISSLLRLMCLQRKRWKCEGCFNISAEKRINCRRFVMKH